MQLHIYKDPEELSEAVAGWMAGYIAEVLKKTNRFTLALSGGSTPKKLHAILAASSLHRANTMEQPAYFLGR